jgi:endonuclease YncB( thermonuclease family)
VGDRLEHEGRDVARQDRLRHVRQDLKRYRQVTASRVLLAATVVSLLCASAASSAPVYRVARVIDGDTIELTSGP